MRIQLLLTVPLVPLSHILSFFILEKRKHPISPSLLALLVSIKCARKLTKSTFLLRLRSNESELPSDLPASLSRTSKEYDPTELRTSYGSSDDTVPGLAPRSMPIAAQPRYSRS